MLNVNENTISRTNQDRLDRADEYEKVIRKTFPSAARAKELAEKVNNQNLIRLNTLEFLHNMDFSIQEAALLGKTEVQVYFTEMKTRHAYSSYLLSDYDGIDWDEVERFLHKLNYYTRVDTHKHPQQGPLMSTYKVFTVSWS